MKAILSTVILTLGFQTANATIVYCNLAATNKIGKKINLTDIVVKSEYEQGGFTVLPNGKLAESEDDISKFAATAGENQNPIVALHGALTLGVELKKKKLSAIFAYEIDKDKSPTDGPILLHTKSVEGKGQRRMSLEIDRKVNGKVSPYIKMNCKVKR